MTQKTIMQLPVPRIDFSNPEEKTLHDEISRLAREGATNNGISDAQDEAIESMTMDLYTLMPSERELGRNFRS